MGSILVKKLILDYWTYIKEQKDYHRPLDVKNINLD